MDAPLIVLLVGALLGTGGLTAFIQARAVNRRTDAETRKTDVDADVALGDGWQVLWASARSDLNEMRERLALIEGREAECRDRLAALERDAHPAAVEQLVMSLIDQEIAKRTLP